MSHIYGINVNTIRIMKYLDPFLLELLKYPYIYPSVWLKLNKDVKGVKAMTFVHVYPIEKVS